MRQYYLGNQINLVASFDPFDPILIAVQFHFLVLNFTPPLFI